MSSSARTREILEVRLLFACQKFGLSPLQPEQLHAAKEGLWADASQNLRGSSSSSCAASRVFPCVCTSSIIYSYEHDRRVSSHEVACAMGWRTSAHSPTIPRSLSEAQLTDLLGNSQALPCLGTATAALLVAIGDHVGFTPPRK